MDKCLIEKKGGWAYVHRGLYLVSTERVMGGCKSLYYAISTQHLSINFIIVRKSSLSFTKSSSLVLIRPMIIIITINIIMLNKIQPLKISKMYKEIYGRPDNLPVIHTFRSKNLTLLSARVSSSVFA